tara:strand:- start:99 stop:383 length:285 start_codon:yes stop_codon:yes gene_type:complete
MIIYAILKINPNAKVTVVGDDIDTCEIKWHDGTTPISKEEIKKILPDVTEEQTILKNRRNEYPSIEDQLDDIYHNGIDGWKETIKSTKDKFPKE